jgi:hypothetical protein
MRKVAFPLIVQAALAGGCAEPIALRTYQGDVLVYPELLPRDQPTILAFLDANDRRCDRLIRPLRALAARKEATLVGVLSYDDNSFLEQISTRREILFPMMLDPRKRLVSEFKVNRYPTFVYLSPRGREIGRLYDIKEINPWFNPRWIDKAMGRDHLPTPEEMVEEAESR